MRRSNFNKMSAGPPAVRAIGAEGLHFHDLRHTGNHLAARSGAGLRDLMARMEEQGHILERFTEEVSARMPTPEEARALSLFPGVPVDMIQVTEERPPAEVADRTPWPTSTRQPSASATACT